MKKVADQSVFLIGYRGSGKSTVARELAERLGFDWIDAEARIAEIRASAEWLEQFEAEPWAFAYPYGGLSDDAPRLLKEHGFLAAFTTQTQLRHPDPYFIGRLDGEEMAQDGLIYD